MGLEEAQGSPLRHFRLRDVCLDGVAQKLRRALSRCTVVVLDEARIGEVPLRERHVRLGCVGVLAPMHLDPLWQSCDACKVQKNCRLVRSIVRDDVRERVGAVRCHHKIVLRTAELLVLCVDYAHLGESGAQTLDEMAEAVSDKTEAV